MKHAFLALLSALTVHLGMAQLPNGTIWPDFTATDLNGVEHNLYSYLIQATRSSWISARPGAALAGTTTKAGCLKSCTTHGPNGTNEL